MPTSLCDLGYCDVGLDDAWQSCAAGTDGYSYHELLANGAFRPVVDGEKFPSLAAMTARAHNLGLTAGWYANNCICRESKISPHALYAGDVDALVSFNFDGIKFDDCGTEIDLNLWASLINATGRQLMIENCHWGRTVPTEDWCPWNMYRTSEDMRASYGNILFNLNSTVHWAQRGLSKPGCWAYPDMLEVGCQDGPGGSAGDPGMNHAEMRSHFGAWAIISSPLILGLDVNDDAAMDEVWPIIANPEAIAVNQAWAGHSGSPFKEAEELVELRKYQVDDYGTVTNFTMIVPAWQYWYKPLPNGEVAVLLMNHDNVQRNLTLTFAEVPRISCQRCQLRDVWRRADLGHFKTAAIVGVHPHDSAFLILKPHFPKAFLSITSLYS